ncbi:MAG: HEAT repeat domain-containing protein [Spirochaetales bacterium]|nr:HEAT repeat domain-containing protein [Spirochaetales bacterium]
MRIKKVIAILVILLLSTGIVFAQDTKKEESIEELYLSNPNVRYAYEISMAEDRDDKLLAIDEIGRLIDEGVSAQDEQQIAMILEDLASQGTTVIIRENGRVTNYYPDVRWEACRILAKVQSDEGKKRAVKALVNVLRQDDDPIVKAKAVLALGEIGTNQDNTAARAIATAVTEQDYMAPNNNFAMSSIIALEKLSDSDDGITDASVLSALVKIMQGNYSRTVKNKAREVLDTLRRKQSENK